MANTLAPDHTALEHPPTPLPTPLMPWQARQAHGIAWADRRARRRTHLIVLAASASAYAGAATIAYALLK